MITAVPRVRLTRFYRTRFAIYFRLATVHPYNASVETNHAPAGQGLSNETRYTRASAWRISLRGGV